MESDSRLADLRRRLVRYLRSARDAGRTGIVVHDEPRETDRRRAEELIRDEGWDRLRDES
ncbi:MAG TPA: hypothetical protein VGF28_00620 [Thermoanaerobaculia bacterium]|jgi:hypothetical protein